MIRLSVVILRVKEQDEALAFYTDKPGFKKCLWVQGGGLRSRPGMRIIFR
jgi:catechol 2,3-dioxygenase-like lactoylglutathione lyase family enzyme